MRSVLGSTVLYPSDATGTAALDGRSNLHMAHLAVRGMPGSGSGEELIAWAGIDAPHRNRGTRSRA
jgi:transketolase